VLDPAAVSLAGLAGSAWPLGFAMAAVAGGGRVREQRRRTLLNRALHELRRPLQVLLLTGPSDARAQQAVEMTVAAMVGLEREINREPRLPDRRPVAVASLVRDVGERWRAVAAARGRPLSVRSHVAEAAVLADPADLSRAVDNLVANALEHGSGSVEIAATLAPGATRVAVADAGSQPARSRLHALRGAHDPRRGHGLAIVTEIARAHGGRFFWLRSEQGSIAVLELPLAGAA
jgi:signal transduction histidine kinase